jgi:hypothetical protein
MNIFYIFTIFSQLINNLKNKFKNYDSFIIDTCYSYPIATCLLQTYKYTSLIKIYDLHPFQVYYVRYERKNQTIIIKSRDQKYKDQIYSYK